MRRLLAAVALLLVAAAAAASTSRTASPSTTNNDDSCDIALQPAATLLLPYFEVDFNTPVSSSTTTLLTIQNVSPSPRIANVTLWTDWGFPAVNFPVHLTGYDVQGINLYDVLLHGTIPRTACVFGDLPQPLVTDLQFLFTTGGGFGLVIPCGAFAGAAHVHAIGYVTVDLVASCAAANVTSPTYLATLLYDNVLTGDYQQLATINGHAYASGGPLVHIRAIPEGGPAGTVVTTSLPYTFYDHYTPDPLPRKIDRRQPLPSLFTPRYINGGVNGFNTTLKIWREGITPGACSGAGVAARSNSNMAIADLVRFDEHENATVMPPLPHLGAPVPPPPGLPATASITMFSVVLPPFSTSGDVGGWLYMNLDNQQMNGRPSQNWVVVSMFAEPAYATEATAPALGNGCSAAVKNGEQIAPAPNPTP